MFMLFGRFIRRTQSEPRILTDQQFRDGDMSVGDLLPVTGGCPRFPGDGCTLIGGHDSTVCSFKGELYYKIVS